MVQSVKHFTIAFLTRNCKKCFLIPTPVQRLTRALRRLGILSQAEDSVRMRLFALFRADPCLRLLEGLEQDLKQKRQQMTVRCFAPNFVKFEKYLTHTGRTERPAVYSRKCTPYSMHAKIRLHQAAIGRVLVTQEPILGYAGLEACGGNSFLLHTTSRPKY